MKTLKEIWNRLFNATPRRRGIMLSTLYRDDSVYNDWHNTVQSALAKLLKTNKFLKDISKWRNDILANAQEELDEHNIIQEELDELKVCIFKEPELFWAYSTS